MQIYKKTINQEYTYSYFDGTYSSAATIEHLFPDVASIQYLYEVPTGKVSDTISHIAINNSGLLSSNFVDIKKGDYILYSKDCNIFSIEKNLDNYIIDDAHKCRKPITISFEYSQFLGEPISTREIINGYKNEIDSLVCSPDFRELYISPKSEGEDLKLLRGDFLVKSHNKKLFSIHRLEELYNL